MLSDEKFTGVKKKKKVIKVRSPFDVFVTSL